MKKIRTIIQTAQLIKEQDPDTAISEKTIRRAIKEGKIPHIKVGTRILINYDAVCRYFEGEEVKRSDE